MANISLQLNADKTEVLLLGPAALNSTLTSRLDSLSSNLKHHVNKSRGLFRFITTISQACKHG